MSNCGFYSIYLHCVNIYSLCWCGKLHQWNNITIQIDCTNSLGSSSLWLLYLCTIKFHLVLVFFFLCLFLGLFSNFLLLPPPFWAFLSILYFIAAPIKLITFWKGKTTEHGDSVKVTFKRHRDIKAYFWKTRDQPWHWYYSSCKSGKGDTKFFSWLGRFSKLWFWMITGEEDTICYFTRRWSHWICTAVYEES